MSDTDTAPDPGEKAKPAEVPARSPYSPLTLLRTAFALREPVTRFAYITCGVVLMAVKFGLERTLFHAWLGRDLGVVGFLSPFFRDRAALLRGAPDGVTWTMIGLAMPFLWLGVSMSVRRALDAGLPPMMGFFFLIPGVNYALMATLSFVPTRGPRAVTVGTGPYRSTEHEVDPPAPPSRVLRMTRSVLVTSGIGFAMFGFCVYVLRSYGTALFLATPFLMGMIAVVSYRSARERNPGYQANRRAVGCGMISLVVTGIGLLMLGFEGGGCIAMALIPAGVLSLLGSVLAITMDSLAARYRATAAILALPLAASVEAAVQRPPVNEVVSSVVVDAPPDVVWERVTSFPDLDPPTEFMFRRGISYPLRAHIDGTGVGAVRYCEFSTGSFVEPITAWEPGVRLSFDVVHSPEPMREWNFWDQVDAPHLHGFMRSKRGEFRLVALPGGKTRLEGSTFYELEIYPSLYWKAVTDSILHAIHGRVLTHIKKVAERDVAERATR